MNAACASTTTDHVSAYGVGFACEVSGVELLEGGVDVVGIEDDGRPDPVVGIDLNEAKYLREEHLGPLIAREADTREDEAFPAGRQRRSTSPR